MSSLPQQPSESVRKLNPHIYGGGPAMQGEPRHATTDALSLPKVAAPPLRQSSKPRCNKTEAAFSAWLRKTHPDAQIRDQAVKIQLCNGAWYTADCVLYEPFSNTTCFYEVKGKRRKDSAWFRDDAKLKIKFAAKEYWFWLWYVVWPDGEKWNFEQIKEN